MHTNHRIRTLGTSGNYLDYCSNKQSHLRRMVCFPSASSNPGNVSIYFWFVPVYVLWSQINQHSKGILTLQPTAQPKTKNAGLVRHQIAILILGFPSILLGTLAVLCNKWLKSADHFTTWHGVCFTFVSWNQHLKNFSDNWNSLYGMDSTTNLLGCRQCMA